MRKHKSEWRCIKCDSDREYYAVGLCKRCYEYRRKLVCKCGNALSRSATVCWNCHIENNKQKLAIEGPYRERKHVKKNRCRSQRKWARNNLEKILYHHAKRRAQEKKLPFTISLEDIKIPECCPILGYKLSVKKYKKNSTGGAHDASPTVDRFIPKLGYIPSNISVISYRANHLKNDGKLEEFEKLTKWMKNAK